MMIPNKIFVIDAIKKTKPGCKPKPETVIPHGRESVPDKMPTGIERRNSISGKKVIKIRINKSVIMCFLKEIFIINLLVYILQCD